MINRILAVFVLALASSPFGAAGAADERPNVIWLTCEDISPNLGCYGDDYAITPVLDELARQGVRYTHAVGISGVCAVNRSCLITGMYPTTIGSQDMRSRIRLPDSLPTYSKLLRDVGYYCTNNSKTDYNFQAPAEAWDESSKEAHWRNRQPGQPFFAVFNYTGTHESQIWEQNHSLHAAKLSPEELHDPAEAPIPPFHPDTPETRRDWANYYDNITALDHWIADHLNELAEADLAENTIVFFYSDHGVGMPMCKKWVWDWGLRVPLIIRFPEALQHLAPAGSGKTVNRIVSFVDFPPTLLSLLGVPVPKHMQGQAFLGAQRQPPRQYAFAIRDRMAEWYATVRVVRDQQYQYHRNFMPHLPWTPFTSYTLTMPTAQVWTRLHEEGKLPPVQERYFHAKPSEELYDVTADPHMIHNLAEDPDYEDVILRMRKQLHAWQLSTRDLGLLSEYEMHRRAEGSTQYDVGQNHALFPIQRILPATELASERDARNVQKLIELLKDSEPSVRWWAALGLAMLGNDAAPAEAALRDALVDESPLVRVAAAEALLPFGDIATARDVLVSVLSDPTPFARLRALNALHRLGKDAEPALPAIADAGLKGIFPADYVNRMVEYLPERLGEP